MTQAKPLFDTAFQQLQRARAKAKPSAPHPLIVEAQARLRERLEDLKEKPPSLITSILELQSSNDLPETLKKFYGQLTQGGLFLGVLAGGESLHELRACLTKAESELMGGASPRVAPMIEAETLARLLPAAGFALPVVDVERVMLSYADLYALMRDLRQRGQTNSLNERPRHFAPRSLFQKANEIYKTRFPAPNGAGIAVTLDLLFMHGWRE